MGETSSSFYLKIICIVKFYIQMIIYSLICMLHIQMRVSTYKWKLYIHMIYTNGSFYEVLHTCLVRFYMHDIVQMRRVTYNDILSHLHRLKTTPRGRECYN